MTSGLPRPSHFVANTVSLIVAGVWGISYLATILRSGYHPDPTLHAALLVVLAGPQALSFWKGGGSS